MMELGIGRDVKGVDENLLKGISGKVKGKVHHVTGQEGPEGE
jgi:hypothetical protein